MSLFVVHRRRSPRCVFLTSLVAVGVACGPSAGVEDDGATTQSDEGPATTDDGPGGSDAAASTTAEPSDDTTGETGAVPCPEGEYCFDVVDFPGAGSSWFVAGDVDADGRAEASFGGAWALDWSDGELRLLGPVDPDTNAARFFAPSPLDGVPQFFTSTGAYVIESGELVVREHPRPEFVGMPPSSGVGMVSGILGPLDFDGDGRHDLLVYETDTPYEVFPDFWVSDVAHTGHLLRFEGDTPTVVGDPLPARIAGWRGVGSMHMAAADFDGDGRDELVVPDDLLIATNPQSVEYNPADNHLVTLRVLEAGGYEELWRAPAGLLAVEVALRDLDADGVFDLLVGGRYGVAVARGYGDGTFDDPSFLDLAPYDVETVLRGGDRPASVQRAIAADLDGNGVVELVVNLRPSDDAVVIEDPLGRAMLRMLLPASLDPPGYAMGWPAMAVGDFDGNGCDDVVSSGPEASSAIRVLMFHR